MYFFYWETKDQVDENGNVIPAQFKGRVKIKAITQLEKLDYLKQITKLDENDNVEKAKIMLEIAKKYTLEVDLVRIEDNYKITSIDEMQYDNDLAVILMQIANAALEGGRLGKNLQKN